MTPVRQTVQFDKKLIDNDAAKVILEGFNVVSISGGDSCTFEESKHFFSYRRDGNKSGRMAHLVWME